MKRRQLLGKRRLSVVLCNKSVTFRKILSFAIKKGKRCQELRKAMWERLEDMSEINERGEWEHLGMSTRSRFIKAKRRV
jgi:hypothetical protein